jgi:hypothetical protein
MGAAVDDALSPSPSPPQACNIKTNTIKTDHNKNDFFITTSFSNILTILVA